MRLSRRKCRGGPVRLPAGSLMPTSLSLMSWDSYVVLEVNESVFMGDSDQTVPRAVEALREQGLLVALDDFGTGHASLTHLLSFPVDIIKIDRSFVERLGVDEPSGVVTRAILDIARQLDMRVVAEGIETGQRADILARYGCHMGQGYLYSRPVPAQDVTPMLQLFGQKPDLPWRVSASASG
ncbi:EAL domain-containing protein [Devosia sp. L53-10-65]|uniref:EAL domain-containing protein n=2 Tax=Devosia marina TaxID=2683198 RepID=A0A7X3FTJ2_9HYPH|nr:EAL domain-containing protein [Devosia marina]